MPERLDKPLRIGLPVLVALGSLFCGTEVLGHKLNVFATAEGNTIHGKVYFRGGTPAQNAKVSVFDPEGEKLGEVTADQQGEFTFQARFRCDHRLVADAGEGHGAPYTVKAEQLPDDLPSRGGATNAPEPVNQQTPAAAPPPSDPPATIPDDARLEQMIEAAVSKQVSKQVGPLGEQLQQYENKIRISDILGGIGYILGITGLLFFFLGARKKGRGSNE